MSKRAEKKAIEYLRQLHQEYDSGEPCGPASAYNAALRMMAILTNEPYGGRSTEEDINDREDVLVAIEDPEPVSDEARAFGPHSKRKFK